MFVAKKESSNSGVSNITVTVILCFIHSYVDLLNIV